MDKEYWAKREFIEFCFKRENKIIVAVYEKRNDPNRPRSVGHGSGISKPTEIEAINLATPLKEVIVDGRIIPDPEMWIGIIKSVKAHYNLRQAGMLYALRYLNNLHRVDILEKMKIGKTRYHQLIIEIVDYAMKKADELNATYGEDN